LVVAANPTNKGPDCPWESVGLSRFDVNPISRHRRFILKFLPEKVFLSGILLVKTHHY
jgi:hypothetical protein